MAKRIIQTATSASRRTRRVDKPTTPWRNKLLTDVPQEIKDANPPGTSFRHVYKGTEGPMSGGTRIHKLKAEGYYEPKVPKGVGGTSVSGGYELKDCKLLALPPDRVQAKQYYVQERAERHLSDAERRKDAQARARGFIPLEGKLDTGKPSDDDL